jgi:hypothetical protein
MTLTGPRNQFQINVFIKTTALALERLNPRYVALGFFFCGDYEHETGSLGKPNTRTFIILVVLTYSLQSYMKFSYSPLCRLFLSLLWAVP